MPSTKAAINELVKTSINNEQYELASPTVWVRIRKFKHKNVIYRDFESTNGLFVARVKEVDAQIDSIILLDPEQLLNMHISETSHKDRPWINNGQNMKNIQASEFAFGVANNQHTDKLQLLITPASYFIKKGELWPSDVKTKLIPVWLDKITNGLFQSNISNIQELKQKLLDIGFIETDQLSDYHKQLVTKTSYDISNEISI